MSDVGARDRWARFTDDPKTVPERVGATPDGLIHAAAHETDRMTLCEHDGPPLLGPPTYLRLNLDSPLASVYRSTVTCPRCLDWMHA